MGIVGGPIVRLSFCKAGDPPIRTAIFAAPDTCAVPFAAASRPKGAGLRISNHMIDRPSVTARPANGPVATIVPTINQKHALGCADQKGQVCLSGRNQIFASSSGTTVTFFYRENLPLAGALCTITNDLREISQWVKSVVSSGLVRCPSP